MTSVYPDRQRTAWISAQRPTVARKLDPFLPQAFFLEKERAASGGMVSSAVILLTNKECPWRCLMCDLWKHTTTQTVPVGAIPSQVAHALRELARSSGTLGSSRDNGSRGTAFGQVKLYNSGSFFDPAAIPVADYAPIAKQLVEVMHVIVESHPRLVGERTRHFRDLLSGSLEVAIGLETIHPEVLPRLNKKFSLAHFADAADRLGKAGIALRAFLLVKPPFLSENEGVDWAVKSAAFAFSCGATAVSLIPTRGGNGAMERLAEAGESAPPQLASLERAQELCLALRAGRVFADAWDLERFSTCALCLEPRKNRLLEANLTQERLPRIACPRCGGG